MLPSKPVILLIYHAITYTIDIKQFKMSIDNTKKTLRRDNIMAAVFSGFTFDKIIKIDLCENTFIVYGKIIS